ncbi:MAG: bifunctional homocysteine S-methyltransferase/methylenetetrahydrofolate reductase [Dehalococcoidia bacterium]|nr:bifunctional homocysteine S-methyltransferase/methylenetetrahydrofolate reductase [Dehalococcoidia bacterium]
MEQPFLAALRDRVLLADGAMGTLLHARGVPTTACLDAQVLDQPDIVRRVHEDYIAAGADVIETDTFGANRFRLARYGLAGKVREINFRAARLARDAREISGHPVFVAGAVGPSGRLLGTVGDIRPEEVRAAFREQAEALLEGGVDVIILETFPDIAELREAVLAVKVGCDLPIVAQMTFQRDGRTMGGEPPDEVANVAATLGADVAGINCSLGPQSAVEVVEQMSAQTSIRLSAMPNAGLPKFMDRRLVYPSTPEYFADYTRKLVEAGANIVGGCCGTTPEHTAAMREALQGEWNARGGGRSTLAARPPQLVRISPVPSHDASGDAADAAGARRSLRQKLAEGEFVVSVELDPPRGLNPRKALEGAAHLAALGADCINIGDSPMARVRMSAIALAVLIEREAGVEPIIHFTSRDRNLMAIQSDLLGAHALGVRNVIALTGDPPSAGDYARATGVWDVDSIGLIKIMKTLNEGADWAGNSIGKGTEFFVACAANPTADDVDVEVERVRRKLEAGADVLMTQQIYSCDVLRSFLERLGPVDVPLLVGVMPLQSHRHTEFIHNELAGVFVPEPVRERMRLAGENGRAEGIAQAAELLEECRPYVQGAYLVPSFGRYEVVGELVAQAKRGA